MTKAFEISKHQFVEAYKRVKANKGAAGVDEESLEDFERNLKDNLYKIWNRMSSGCYFPPEIKGVEIPKKTGGKRLLGIPTVGDRIAQMVVKLTLEQELEQIFLADSYGYRPNKSALDAVGVTRTRCWHYDWLIEFDIKGLFDNIPHDLLMKALQKHTENRWLLLYTKRWLTAPMQTKEGTKEARNKGTPQGGVISPLLSNLFLHYVFDKWMQRNHKENPWCRYADDGLIHCRTKAEAEELLAQLGQRFEACGLELHPEKTKIVYCKDGKRKDKYRETSFDFLGYRFRAREVRNRKDGRIFVSFTPAVSPVALKSMRAKTRKCNWRNRTDLQLDDIAKRYNPVLQGWLNYYGRYQRRAMEPVYRHFNKTLVAWAMKKYKSLGNYKTKAGKLLERITKKNPSLFVHWREGICKGFA